MKKHLFNLLLIAISSFTFTNTSSAQCNYNVDMQDSFGDGWNGASIDVSVNGAFVTNFTIATGSSGSGSFSTYTNDIVEWIDHSQFRFVSRSNGYLNTGGYRISPSEIEETLLKINNIIDVHVYGKPNSLLGTIVCADVIGKNIDSKNIKKEMMKITDKQKIPQVIRVVESFEHVSNGKKRLMI